MTSLRHKAIDLGLKAFAASKLHRLLAPLTRGKGAILTFHHVRPWADEPFAPNRLLEITPAFLDALLAHLKRAGYLVVPLDVVPALLGNPTTHRFVALTFDDGYRDNVVHALPVLERHNAPFTIYVTTGFLDRTARLWWVELERALRLQTEVVLGDGPKRRVFATRTPAQKESAFRAVSAILERGSDAARLAAVHDLGRPAGIDGRAVVESLCINWRELAALAAHPLATIGCHTRTHPRLATLPLPEATVEMADARAAIAHGIGRPVRHLAYPYGGAGAAGPRDFALAENVGFATAVTTRPGVLSSGHRRHLTALPRISVNGLWQTTDALDVLLSGAPFAFL